MKQLVFMLLALAAELPKRHPNPFVHISRDDSLAQLDAVKADVGGLNDAQIAIRIQQMVAQIRDAHTESDTRVEPWTYLSLTLSNSRVTVSLTGASTSAPPTSSPCATRCRKASSRRRRLPRCP